EAQGDEMANVIFVAPFFLETTLRFINGAADLPEVRLGVISQDPAEKIPPGLRSKLAAHWRVEDGMNPAQIVGGVHSLAARMGPPDRLLAALEHLQVPLAKVREHLGLSGMTVETARNFRDKSHMKTLFQQSGVPCARHKLVESSGEARSFVAECGFPAVVKPNEGAGAKNTYRINDDAQLDQYLAAYPPQRAPALFEEFMRGEEHSFDSVWIDGQCVWHSISRYLPTPLEVMENPWIQWCVLLPRGIQGEAYEPIRKAAGQAHRTLGVRTALTHLEWFRRPDGSVAVSEVAARPPGAQFSTLISYAHDIDLYSAWPRLMIFDRFDPPRRRWSVGAAYLRGQGQGRVKGVHGLEQAQKELGRLVVEVRLPQLGAPAGGTYEGDGYVILRHAETGPVEEGLARLVQLIQVELA
ncbi:MAG TPA: ATP-grasp domain-containing protein, partial [Acidobacteriota bacterium]|nr:ATP-grasp domain-containing protein [Acidobacteriota bacterium]